MSTATSYRGSGGKPPESTGGGSKYPRASYFLAEKIDGEKGPELKKINPFKVDVGKRDVPVVVLDERFDYAVRLHCRFKARGAFGNYAVCISQEESRGCPLDVALNQEGGRWFLVGTVIDRSSWRQPSGKSKGKVWKDQRKLLLIPAPQREDFEELGKKIDGYRGATFDVSRRDDQKSSRIGTTWFPTGKMTDEQLAATFEKAASEYGLSVEKFVQPFDYDAMLKPKSYEQLKVIAQEIVNDTSDVANDGGSSGESDGSATSDQAIDY